VHAGHILRVAFITRLPCFLSMKQHRKRTLTFVAIALAGLTAVRSARGSEAPRYHRTAAIQRHQCDDPSNASCPRRRSAVISSSLRKAIIPQSQLDTDEATGASNAQAVAAA
jgi:hypothetical protein